MLNELIGCLDKLLDRNESRMCAKIPITKVLGVAVLWLFCLASASCQSSTYLREKRAVVDDSSAMLQMLVRADELPASIHWTTSDIWQEMVQPTEDNYELYEAAEHVLFGRLGPQAYRFKLTQRLSRYQDVTLLPLGLGDPLLAGYDETYIPNLIHDPARVGVYCAREAILPQGRDTLTLCEMLYRYDQLELRVSFSTVTAVSQKDLEDIMQQSLEAITRKIQIVPD